MNRSPLLQLVPEQSLEYQGESAAFPCRERHLEHNLDAAAIGDLSAEVEDIEADLETLIADMHASIAEAESFLEDLPS